MEGEYFKSSHDGRCLDFAIHHGLDHLVAWRCQGGSNQRWYIQGNSLRSRRDNRCLTRYGNFVRVSHCNPASRGQQWTFQNTRPPVNNNCCTRCGGRGFCSPQSGRCYDFQSKPYYQQCSAITPVRPVQPVHAGPVLSLLDGQCLALDLRRGEIVIQQCNGGRTQQWRMEGEYFKSSHDGRCLDFAIHHGLDHLVAWRCQGGSNQRWYIQGNSLRSRRDNRCLTRYGNFVRVSHCNPASRGQQWSFQRSQPTRPPVNIPGRSCCSTCSQFGKAFCSPQSGRCYDFQAKPYYQRCGWGQGLGVAKAPADDSQTEEAPNTENMDDDIFYP